MCLSMVLHIAPLWFNALISCGMLLKRSLSTRDKVNERVLALFMQLSLHKLSRQTTEVHIRLMMCDLWEMNLCAVY